MRVLALPFVLFALLLLSCGRQEATFDTVHDTPPPVVTTPGGIEGTATIAATRPLVGNQPTPRPIPTISVTVNTLLTPEMTWRSPEVEAYWEEVTTIVRDHALYRDQLDWEQIDRVVMSVADEATTLEDIYPAIDYLLWQLNDNHSFFSPPADVARLEAATVADNPTVTSEMVAGRIGYLKVPGFSSANEAARTAYAQEIQAQLGALAAENPCGWIVDLRTNRGGTLYPMLAGLGPLLGNEVLGYFVSPTDEQSWSYEGGQALIGNAPMVTVTQPLILEEPDQPVAVLMGSATASAGEAIALSFRGRPHTRLFGSPTSGVSTGNHGFALSDGAALVLTVAVFADRTGETYGGTIAPDVLVEEKATTIEVATEWLLEQCETP